MRSRRRASRVVARRSVLASTARVSSSPVSLASRERARRAYRESFVVDHDRDGARRREASSSSRVGRGDSSPPARARGILARARA
jgi:hypothetical protein